MIARLAILCAVLLLVSPAHAQRCGDDTRAWVERCAQTSGLPMEPEACPASVVIVSTTDLRIEISTAPTAFLHAGAYGVSPVGDFADWKLEPVSRQRALEAVARCVEREPPRHLVAGGDPAPAVLVVPRVAGPWLLVSGALLALVACIRRSRATPVAIVVVLATFLLRRWLLPFAFFHQNGQGPLWVEYAFRGDAGEYGPGYAEIFGWASHVRRPERGLALLQEALAATIPLSAYGIARSSGATRVTAAILGVALALDPVLLRVAQSESYFSIIAALLFAAGAVLATTDRRHRIVGLLASALLVAQAARIHPLAWVPCALVPLVLVCRAGRLRARLVRLGVAAFTIALVTIPLVLPAMRVALRGGLGGSFMPAARALVADRGSSAALVLGVFLVLAVAPRTRRVGSRAFVLALVIVIGALTDVLARDAPVVRAAHGHLLLPAAIAVVACVRVRWAGVLVGALAAAHIVMERRLLILPTDARELDWALQWREELPPGAEVASLGRIENRLLPLPLLGQGLPSWKRIDEEGHAHFEQGPRFYYRSSLCSAPEGAPVCARFENAHTLRPMATRRFPSMESLPWEPLPSGEIEVTLFAVE